MFGRHEGCKKQARLHTIYLISKICKWYVRNVQVVRQHIQVRRKWLHNRNSAIKNHHSTITNRNPLSILRAARPINKGPQSTKKSPSNPINPRNFFFISRVCVTHSQHSSSPKMERRPCRHMRKSDVITGGGCRISRFPYFRKQGL